MLDLFLLANGLFPMCSEYYLNSTWTIVRLSQYQCSNPGGNGQIFNVNPIWIDNITITKCRIPSSCAYMHFMRCISPSVIIASSTLYGVHCQKLLQTSNTSSMFVQFRGGSGKQSHLSLAPGRGNVGEMRWDTKINLIPNSLLPGEIQ